MRHSSVLLCSLLLSAIVLTSCSSIAPLEVGAEERERLHDLRTDRLITLNSWRLKGKLAVNNGADGGSGKLTWQELPHRSSMSFHGALGRGAWRLEADDSGATLETADGETWHENTVEQLVQEHVGWQIPVTSLAWWIRGLAAPGDWEDRVLDSQGMLQALTQNGWRIEYGNYREYAGFLLPVKMTARRDMYSVKMAVRDWNLDTGETGGE